MQVDIRVANILIGSKQDALNIIINLMDFFMPNVKSKGLKK